MSQPNDELTAQYKKYWQSGWDAIKNNAVVGAGLPGGTLAPEALFSVRVIAALRQLVHRNWNLDRTCYSIDGAAMALHEVHEEPGVFLPMIREHLERLLKAELDIQEAESAVRLAVFQHAATRSWVGPLPEAI